MTDARSTGKVGLIPAKEASSGTTLRGPSGLSDHYSGTLAILLDENSSGSFECEAHLLETCLPRGDEVCLEIPYGLIAYFGCQGKVILGPTK